MVHPTIWIQMLTVAMQLEMTFQQLRHQVIGYTREEHLRYARYGLSIELPPHRQPIRIGGAPEIGRFSRN